MRIRDKKGFTLIEVMFVAVIIGILTAIVIARRSKAPAKPEEMALPAASRPSLAMGKPSHAVDDKGVDRLMVESTLVVGGRTEFRSVTLKCNWLQDGKIVDTARVVTGRVTPGAPESFIAMGPPFNPDKASGIGVKCFVIEADAVPEPPTAPAVR